MTIQELGSLGEFLAAIATLATLIYLARQVRENTRALDAESDRAAHTFSAVSAHTLGIHKQAASVFRRGIANPADLDPDEQIQFSFLFAPLVNQAHSVHQDARRGMGERDESHTEIALGLLQTPGGRAYWATSRMGYGPEFRKLVDDALSAGETPDPGLGRPTPGDDG
ncbi:MAG: hypothetical protein AAGC67_22595 [Myxococcota bacterium]